MGKKFFISGLLFLAAAGNANAANFAVITSPPTLLNVIIFIVAVACLAGTAKILNLVRGGQLSKSWQLFLAGFGVFALCELVVLADYFEIFTLPSFVVPAGFAVMGMLFLFGIIEIKRVLS